MNESWTSGHATKQDLEQVEDLIKRKWKTLLVLLALALRVKPEAPAKAKPPAVEKPAKPAAIAKVFLIDADPASSEELATVLEIGGFEVVTSLDPDKAVRKIKEASMVILDDELSHAEEICSRIREQSNAPIILMGSEPNGKAWNRAVDLAQRADIVCVAGSIYLVGEVLRIWGDGGVNKSSRCLK